MPLKLNYESNSPDAMFARILSRMEQQDRSAAEYRAEVKAMLADIQAQTAHMHERVTKLENWRWYLVGFAAAVAAIATVAVELIKK